ETQQSSRIVGLPSLARDYRNQFLLAPVRIVLIRRAGRNLPDVRGEIRKKAAYRSECFLFAINFVVNRAAAARVDARTAQLFFGDLLAYAALDDRRACAE